MVKNGSNLNKSASWWVPTFSASAVWVFVMKNWVVWKWSWVSFSSFPSASRTHSHSYEFWHIIRIVSISRNKTSTGAYNFASQSPSETTLLMSFLSIQQKSHKTLVELILRNKNCIVQNITNINQYFQVKNKLNNVLHNYNRKTQQYYDKMLDRGELSHATLFVNLSSSKLRFCSASCRYYVCPGYGYISPTPVSSTYALSPCCDNLVMS